MSRTGHHWAMPKGDTPSYNNNGRRPDWTYDASGNVLTRDGDSKIHSYNAAGQQHLYDESGLQPTSSGYLYSQNTIDLTYNGDDEAGKRVETRYTETENGSQNNVTTTYYVRSTVLGGAVIAGVDQFGGKREGHVYAGGQKITDTSGLHNVNPVTGAWVSTAYTLGVILGTRTELDPLGADVGASDPYTTSTTYSDIMGLQSLYEERGNPFDLAGGCALDGVAIPCSEAMQRLQSGVAEQLIPVNYYVTATRNGQTVFSGFAGTGYARPEDMLMSQTTTHGSLTPEQTQQFRSQLGNQSFWAGMLNGSIDFNTSYAHTTYSDDVGTHDISTPYNVNIFGGAAIINVVAGATVDNPYPGCITIGWLVNEGFISVALKEAWENTEKTGEENGLFMVYNAKANRVSVGIASQGVHTPDPSGGTMPAMPNFRKDYNAFVNSLGGDLTFLTDAHTHPSKGDYPSSFDSESLYQVGGYPAKGIIITGIGKYSLYSFAGKVPYQEAAMKDCISDKVSMPSIHVRFRQ